MQVSLVEPAADHPDQPDRHQVVLSSREPEASDLKWTTHLGVGVYATVDLLGRAPRGSWHSVRIESWDETSLPLVRELIGNAATQQVGAWLERVSLRRGTPHLVAEIAADTSRAGPWLRLVATDALDRWLQAPLNQALVDAERGIARHHAASTLPPGPARQHVQRQGLILARRASHGVSGYLWSLSERSAPPAGLHSGVRRLAEGYAALIREVRGPDRDLQRVLLRWHDLTERSHERRPATSSLLDLTGRATIQALRGPSAPSDSSITSLIDPRQVRARVLRLSADPQYAEIAMRVQPLNARSALIKVPAYGSTTPGLSRGDGIMVRLVDRETGHLRSDAVLTLTTDRQQSPGAEHAAFFEGTVSLPGSRVEGLRADVFDKVLGAAPASTDSDEALQQVRRAALFLREWRQLVAAARLPAVVTGAAQRLNLITRLLEPRESFAHSDRPLFAGGPSPADLNQLAGLGDAELIRSLRAGTLESSERVSTSPIVGSTDPPAGLLVAELAAAHRASSS
jgi:hypothetical protein